jgi:hypothetical protein
MDDEAGGMDIITDDICISVHALHGIVVLSGIYSLFLIIMKPGSPASFEGKKRGKRCK